MDGATFLRIILRGWWLIVLVSALTVGSVAYIVLHQTPRYQATTTIEIKPSPELNDTRQIISALSSLEGRTILNTIVRHANGSTVRAQVARALDLPRESLREVEISAISLPTTNLIQVRVVSDDPHFSAAISDATATALLTQVPAKLLEMEIIDRAVPPVTPIEPQPSRMITIAIMVGLALGVAVVILKHLIQQLRITVPVVVAEEPAGWIEGVPRLAQE